MKEYSDAVCGGIDKVKRMFVNEFKRKRLKKNISPKEIDRIVGLSKEWPSVEEIEAQPELFSMHFHEAFTLAQLDDPEAHEKLFGLTGDEISLAIKSFIGSDSKRIDEAVADYKKCIVYTRATLWGPEPEEYMRKVLEGEPVKLFSANMFTPGMYAHMHIYSCIMQELSALDPKKIS